jgi:hypothetical protein
LSAEAVERVRPGERIATRSRSGIGIETGGAELVVLLLLLGVGE